jgi:membrane fusion protein, heavy metal efflux system
MVAGCQPSAPHEEKGEEKHAHEEEHAEGTEPGMGGGIHLEDVRGVSFTAVAAVREEGAWFPAEAVADPSAAAAISSPVRGIVTGFRAELGQAVARGAALVEIRSPELADLKAAWLGARAQKLRAGRDLERERRLAAGAATSQRDVEAAEASAAVAEAQEAAARLALEARGVRPEAAGTTFVVSAPRSGTVSTFTVVLGQGIEAGQELGRLVAPGASRVQVELPLPAPEGWSPGVETEVRQADGRRWKARVEGVPPELSNETRRLTYRLRLEGPKEGSPPLAGTPLEVRVPLARAVVLPQTALQQIEGNWGVFVRNGDRAVFRPVRKGAELGGEVLVLEGIAPGESVATEGAYLLKSLSLKLAGGGDAHDH